jgi:hypothetical protein
MGAFDDLIPKAPAVAGADPRDFTDRYNTQLSPEDEQKFNLWAQANNRVKDSYDYDMRGAYQELMSGQTQQADNGHFTDKFKKPNHPTFSNESQYNGVDGFSGGQWVETPKGTSFAPGQSQSKLWPADELGQYFKQTEPDITLMQPDRMDRIATGSAAPVAGGGTFDDLIPKALSPVAQAAVPVEKTPAFMMRGGQVAPTASAGLMTLPTSVPERPQAGAIVMDDGTTGGWPAGPSDLLTSQAGSPDVLAAAAKTRGGADELGIFGSNLNSAFHQGVIPAIADSFAGGGVARAQQAAAENRAKLLAPGGMDNLTPWQRKQAMLDPVLAQTATPNMPGRPVPTMEQQQGIAAQLRDDAMQDSMRFAQQQGHDEAIAQATPSWTTAEGPLNKTIAGLSSGVATGVGAVLDPVNFFFPGAGRAKTALGTAVREAVPGAVSNMAFDPLQQSARASVGLQDGGYNPEQTALAGATGGVITGAMGGLGHAFDDYAPGLWNRAQDAMRRRNTEPVFPGGQGAGPGVNADDLFQRTKAVSEQGQQLADDPAFQAQMIQQNTGTDLPPSQTIPPSGGRLTPQQYAARKQTESELANLFTNESSIWPRAQVEVGPDGIHIPEGVEPVRDALGQQAHTDTLAPRGMAVDALGKIDPLPPNPADISRLGNLFHQQPDVSVGDVVGHAQASGNVQRMRETAAQREELGLKPETDRDRRLRERSEQQTERAFRLAERERERAAANEGKTNDANPMYAGEGAESARMAQDRAAQSNLPNKERDQLRGEFEKAGLADVPEPHMAEAERLMASGLSRKGAVNRVLRQNPVEAAKPERAPNERSAETSEPSPAPEPKAPEPEPAPAESAPPAEKAPGGPDDILDRAFAPREEPAVQPEKPNLDHLTPDQQRRATALDHEIAASKAFDPPEETARLQQEYDDLVSGKAPESAPEAKPAETPAETPAAPGTHPVEVLDAIDRELAATKWDEKGGQMIRGNDGKVSRSKWLSSNPDIHGVLTKYKGVTVEQARNLIARAKSGKGKPLTERQQNIVDDLAGALAERNQRAPREGSTVERVTKKLDDAKAERDRAVPPEEKQQRGDAIVKKGRDSRLWQEGDDAPYPPKGASEEHIEGRLQRSFNRDYIRSLNYAKEARAKADHLRNEGASKKDRAAAEKEAAEAERLLARQSELAPGRVDQFNKDFDLPPRSSKDIQAHHEKLKKTEQDFEADAARLKREGTAAEAKAAENRAIHAKANRVSWEKHHPELVGTPKEKAPDLELKGQTEAERAASEKETKAKDKEQADTRKAAEDKAQADKDAKDFKLSGSDSPADKAASHGQGTLMDVTGVPARAGKILKAIYKRLVHGDDEGSMSDTAHAMAQATRELLNQERPTKSGRIKDGYRRFLTDTDSNLRSLAGRFKSEIAQQIPDQFHVQAGDKGGKGPSLDERRQQQANPRQHKIEELDKWMKANKINTPEAHAQIIKLVENPNTPRRGLLGEAAKKIEDFYKEMHDYQKAAGIDVGHVKGYFQRVLDTGQVAGHRGKFITAAKKAYKQDNPHMSEADLQRAAENYWDREVNGDSVKPGAASQASGGSGPSHLKARTFSKEAAKHLDAFQVKEIPAMLSSYLHRAVQRAETAKSGVTIDGKFQPFGENFKHWDTITDAIRKQDPEFSGVQSEFNDLVGTSAGISNSKASSTTRNVTGAIKTVTTLSTMARSALSSMTELMTPSMRASMGEFHDLPQAIKAMGEHGYNSVRNVVAGKAGRTQKLQNSFDVAKTAGVIGGSGQHSLMAARAAVGDPAQRTSALTLSKFFGRNGLEDLTNYQRATATGQAMDFLHRLSATGRQGKAKTDRYLGELGIPTKDQPAFTKFVRDLNGKHATPADLKGPMGEKYKTALLRFSDQAVQRPSPSTRPAWANDPVGSTLFQLQSFNYTAQKNILNRMAKQLKDKDLSVAERGKMAGSFMAHMAAMSGISAAIWEGRDAYLSRPDSRKLTTGAKIERAISGAGGFGKFDSLFQAAGGGIKYGAPLLSSMAGPGVSNAAQLLSIPSDLSGPGNSPHTNTAERKAARTIYNTVAAPALQAAATALPNSPLGLAATFAIPKAGEWAVDKLLPADTAPKDLPPVKGTIETLYDKFTKEDDDGKPKRPVRPERGAPPKRAQRPHS